MCVIKNVQKVTLFMHSTDWSSMSGAQWGTVEEEQSFFSMVQGVCVTH